MSDLIPTRNASGWCAHDVCDQPPTDQQFFVTMEVDNQAIEVSARYCVEHSALLTAYSLPKGSFSLRPTEKPSE